MTSRKYHEYLYCPLSQVIINNTAKSSPLFTVILGDFNARSKFWWVNDKTSLEGTRFEAFVVFHGFEQFISVPHLLLPNLTSCIDLIFTDQLNLVVDCDVHPTLQLNFHHQIVHCKLSLKIEYHLPYERLVWDYRKQIVRI